MKKFVAILASVVIAAFSTLSAFAAETVNSPTAPVIPTTVPATTAPVAVEKVPVTIDAEIKWGTVYAYFYNENSEIGAEGESVPVEYYVDADGVKHYVIDVPAGYKYVIFHDGKGEQTVAVPVEAAASGKGFTITATKNDKGEYVAEVVDTPSTTKPADNGSSTSPQTSDNLPLVGLGVLLAAAAGTVAVKKLAK